MSAVSPREMEEAINKANINAINNDIKEVIYSDCKHEFEDTGYCQLVDGSEKTIYCCSVCGLEKLEN